MRIGCRGDRQAKAPQLRKFKDIEKISPARLVSAKAPPVLCGYGLKDHLVPSHLKFKLTKAFDSYGVSYDYMEFPNSNHGMYGDLDILQSYIDKALEYCSLYFTDNN